MSNEDFPPVDDIRKGDCRVGLPLAEGVDVLDEDDEVVRLALVEDLAGSVFAAHCG